MDRLDAVNEMLGALGEDRVASLDTGLADASRASEKLDTVTAEVLEAGWHCNIDTGVDLHPTADGFIPIGDDVLRLAAPSSLTIRTDPNDGIRKLYDRTRHSFAFTRSARADVVRNLPFQDLTHALQTYITAKAARDFQMNLMGSATLDAACKRQMEEAWAKLLDAEAETDTTNILTQSPFCVAIRQRNSDFRGM